MVENADRVAIIAGGEEHSFRSLTAAVAEREHAFRTAGVAQGDVVILVGDFSFDPLVSLLALLFCKAAVIPLTRNAHAKLGPSVDRMGPDVLIDSFAGGAVQRISREPSRDDDAGWRRILPEGAGAVIVFTSGSTGAPKAIVHDADALCYRYLDQRRPIRAICFLLFDHMGGINTVLSLLFRGGTAIDVSDRLVDPVCQAVQAYKAELLPTTPSFLSNLLMARAHQSYDLASLRVISYGTEVMSEAVLKKLNQVLPDCTFKQTYGLSETGVLQIKSKSNDSLWFQITDSGVEWKVEENVLWIKTRSNLLGKVLFDSEDLLVETRSHEWFCTNDLVETDGEYLKILGRQTDIINVGGLKVYPSEVENCIHELPFVDDVFVQGKKNPLLGQVAVAHVRLDGSLEDGDAKRQIRRHCLARLEKFKVPSQIVIGWGAFINDRFKKVRST